MGYQKLILSRKMTPVALLLLVASVSGFEDGSTQKEKDLTKLRSLVLGRQATGEPGWFIANLEENCNDACLKIGLECTEYGLKAHNKEVDSSKKMLALLKSLGQEIGVTSCDGQYGNSPGVPNFSKKDKLCLHSSSGREKFSCEKKSNQPASQEKQRLCYCDQKGKGIILEKLVKLQGKIGWICFKQCMKVWHKTWTRTDRTKTDECREQCSFS